MSDPFDRLEAELAALQPARPSAEFRQRLADKLLGDKLLGDKLLGDKLLGDKLLPYKLGGGVSTVALPHRGRVFRGGLAIGGLIAACVMAALLVRPGGEPKRNFPSNDGPMEVSVAAAFDEALPAVWTYRRALNRPQPALEALLDEHAALSTSGRSGARAQFFIRLDTELLNGEL